LSGWRSPNRGLLQVTNAPSGIFIAYATAPGSTASDNQSGQNGLYTQELLKAMRQPGMRNERKRGLMRCLDRVVKKIETARRKRALFLVSVCFFNKTFLDFMPQH
jgi:caspase domain-containing protein